MDIGTIETMVDGQKITEGPVTISRKTARNGRAKWLVSVNTWREVSPNRYRGIRGGHDTFSPKRAMELFTYFTNDARRLG